MFENLKEGELLDFRLKIHFGFYFDKINEDLKIRRNYRWINKIYYIFRERIVQQLAWLNLKN